MRKSITAVSTILLVGSLLVAAPAALPSAPFTVKANATGCVDDNGNEVTCPISVDPIPLPVGKTIAEDELGLVSRNGTGTVQVQPYEWSVGSSVGACVPLNGACNLQKKIQVGPPTADPTTGAEVPSYVTAPGLAGTTKGDAATVAMDLDGNGQQELISAVRCPLGGELCLSIYDPATNGYGRTGTEWFRTGVLLEGGANSVGRIRLAAGMVLRTSATVNGASFSINPDGGVLATFTTTAPHGFIPGQPIRFQDNADLAAAMCPALAKGSVLCGGGTSASWLPIESVPSDTTFTVRVGNAIDAGGASGTDAGPQIPAPWPASPQIGTLSADAGAGDSALHVVETGDAPPGVPFDVLVGNDADGFERVTVVDRYADAGGGNGFVYGLDPRTVPVDHTAGEQVLLGCTTCSLGVTGVRPGVVAAFSGPGKVATLAVFSARPGARKQFRLLDEFPVGKITGAREPLDVVSGDFDADGQDEVAVAWAGAGQGLLRFFAVSDAKQIVPLGTTSAWESTTTPYALSLTSGSIVPLPGTNVQGDDVAVAWGSTETGGHLLRAFDVTTNFQLRSMSLQGGVPDGYTYKGDWVSDAGYEKNDVVRDTTGFWTTPGGGQSFCTTDTDSASKFYFADPITGKSTWAARLPQANGQIVWPTPTGNFWSTDPNLTGGVNQYIPALFGGAQRATGPAKAFLDPNPPAASEMGVVTWAYSQQPPSNVDILQGQYVSAPLADQTIDGRAAAVIAAANLTGDQHARAQLTIRVVSNDGSVQRAVLYQGPVDGGVADSYGPGFLQGSTIYGTGLHFPTTNESARSVALTAYHVHTGDRLVIEVGTHGNVDGEADSTATSGIWLGAKGQGDLPPIDGTPHVNYVPDGQGASTYHWLDPTLTFTNPIQLDNCNTHVSDQGIRDWTQVQAGPELTAWAGPNTPAEGLNSAVRVVAADLDMDGVDELALAQTTSVTGDWRPSPVQLQVWKPSVPDCTNPSDPAEVLACPVANGAPKKMPFSRTARQTLDGVTTYGPNSSGQLTLQAGRVGAIDGADPTFPNAVNPDLVIGTTWSNIDPNSGNQLLDQNGDPDAGTQITPVDVCIPGTDDNNDGVEDICASDTGMSFTSRTPITIHGPVLDATTKDWSAAEFALPDFDRDSKTLGSPLEYLETGRVQPMLVLRSPPVHFDAFDENGDGTISPDEVYDVNKCFSQYLATGEDYVCHTTSSYGSSTTVDSTVSGEVHTAGSYSWGGNGTVSAGVGGESQGCEGGDGEPVYVKTETSGWCVEGVFYLNLASSTQQSAGAASQIGRTFSYSSTVTTSAGTDAVYAALQQNEVLEYPIYAGAGWGLGSGDPIQYLTQKTPLQTRFRWMSSQDFGVPLTGAGLSPQDVLSYSPTENQLKNDVASKSISSIKSALGGTAIDVTLSSGHGLSCVQTSADVPDATPIEIERKDLYSSTRRSDLNYMSKATYPCAVGTTAVEIQNSRTLLDRSYLVTQALSGTEVRLQPTVPFGSLDAATLGTAAAHGSFIVTPGDFPADEWTVQRFHALDAEVVTSTASGYERSFGWGIGSELGFGAKISAAGSWDFAVVSANVGGSVGFNYSEEYTKEQLQTLSLGTTQETRFGIEVTGDISPDITYTIRPFLLQSPSGAMILDWTTGVDPTESFWQTHYGTAPDPAFALPNLLTPYKAPSPVSQPQAVVPTLLQSVDFAAWDCAQSTETKSGLVSYSDCSPAPEALPDQPLVLMARVHNYSLAAYDSATPIRVRFYLGDPAKGGYEIERTEVPSLRSPECVNTWCLPSRQSAVARVEWDWHRDYPGLTAQGSPIRPLPIYAIIDPSNSSGSEVHDLLAPVDVRACAASYPTTDGPAAPSYTQSDCPTTNNEGFFTQRFGGEVGASSTDISVSPSDVKVMPDGSIQVSVHASKATGAVEVRLYECGVSTCIPQTVGGPEPTVRVIGSIAAGSTASTRFALPHGTHHLAIQVIAKQNWERPGGGPFDVDGQLANNQTYVTLTS